MLGVLWPRLVVILLLLPATRRRSKRVVWRRRKGRGTAVATAVAVAAVLRVDIGVVWSGSNRDNGREELQRVTSGWVK